MSNKRITDLTELTNPTTDDVFPVVDIASNTTTKVQLGNLPVPTSVTTALATKENTITPGTTAQYFRGDKSFQTLDKTAVGLANVDNTSDANKPVSTAQQTALNAKQDTLVSGTNIKTLNSTSLLGSGNIVLTANPSGVAGAIQFSNGSAFASDAANLFWDDTNNRLGVGTNAPSGKTQIITDDATSPFAYSSQLTQLAGSALQGLLVGYSSTNGSFISSVFPGTSFSNITYTALEHRFSNTGTVGMVISPNVTTIGNGTTSLGARLGIKGSGSTSATTSLLVQNSSGVSSLQVTDDGSVFNLGKGGLASNTAYGKSALGSNTTGVLNVAYGQNALSSNLGANANTAVGNGAMSSNTVGENNTAIGYGTQSGNFTGSTMLGFQATATGNNQFVVGSSAVNAGAVNSTSDVPATFLWSVRINGTNYKILMTT